MNTQYYYINSTFLDLPVIISEDYCGFLEPQEHIWKGESGKGYYLKDVRYTCPDLVRPFNGVGDFSMLSPSFDGKTLFRFPLRNTASKLSNEVYTVEKLRKLLEALKAEAKYLLLFLRSVCSIEVVEISQLGNFEQVFKVCISSRDSTKRQSEQQLLVRRVESTFTGDSPYAVRQVIQETAHFHIEMIDGSINSEYEWVVVHRIGSDNPKVLALAEKQHVLPWVGTAFEVSDTDVHSKGRIFCFLPLPTEDKTPFGIHVNGTFAVSSNRRALKWEAHERQDDQEGTWNKLLVQYCVPHCYAQLIQVLVRMPSLPHKIVYNCWPSLQLVQNTPWEGILKTLFETILLNDRIVYTEANNGQWISLAEAMFVPKAGSLSPAVKKVLLLCRAKVVDLSTDQWNTIEHYYKRSVSIIGPSHLRNYLRQNRYAYKSMSYEEKLDILQYCLSDNNYSDMIGLELIPLVNCSFATFQNTSRYFASSHIYVCSTSIRYNLLPGVQHMMVDLLSSYPLVHTQLTNVANSSETQLTILGVSEVAQLLPQSNSQSWSQQQLEKFWKWLQNYDLSIFQSKYIVPVKHSNGSISIQTLNKQAGLIYVTQYAHSSITSTLKTALEKYGITLASVNDFSYLSHQLITKYIYQFEAGEVIDAIPPYSLSNTELTDNEACALQNFLAATNTSFANAGRINRICAMSIFSVLQYHDVRYSINTLKSQGMGNKAVVQGDYFEFRTDLLPSQPLVINKNNNSKILQNLVGHVNIMNGIEFLENVVFPKINCNQFPVGNLTDFMKSIMDSLYLFLQKFPRSRTSFTKAISTLPFVTVDSGERKSPSTLFDPQDQLLLQLYLGEPVFPKDEYQSYIFQLRQCGLRTSVTATDIYDIICTIQPYPNASTVPVKCSPVSYSRMVALLKVLNTYPNLINQSVKVQVNYWSNENKTLKDAMIERAKSYNYLPVASDPPSDYPHCLTWKASMLYPRCFASSNTENVVVHSGTLDSTELYRIVGSQAIFVENFPSQMCQGLSTSKRELANAVVKHFENVIDNETEIESHVLEQIAFQTYRYLGSCDTHVINLHSIKNWVWVESHSTFFSPQICALQANPSFRMNIEPFIFVLSSRMREFESLLNKFGVVKHITPVQIVSVLQTIREEQYHVSDHDARSTIKNILEWVVLNPDLFDKHEILVPIESDETYPQLLPSDEVAYTDNDMLLQIAKSSDEEYKLVHSSVAHLAPQLGLTPLSDQLDITEEVFEDAGQHEPLTTRLSNILKEYKDGLTIIKEMIQNADDAEATEVNILYDARSHTTDRLLFEGVADSHGPALVVHNNSTFTEEDFANITKLAGATKKDKPLKIGKFGVGFCSVYHITDIPSFVSGEWLYIFDPTLKHLRGVVKNENQPGKRMKYMSKFISKSQQLVPYQGLFGFDTSIAYSGTMFRFPFRRNASQISSTIYGESIVNELREDLTKNGSRLLLFLNHVKKITFQSIRNNDSDAFLQLIIERRDNSDSTRKVETHSFLSGSVVKETWLVSSHTEQLHDIYQHQNQSLATVGCQLTEESGQFRCQPLNEGSVFCFLPLSVPSTGLPVHVSANFAVMSNRSGIWTSTSSSSPSDSREWWNLKLMEVVIPKAYCKLLKLLKDLHNSNKLVEYDFFALLPLTEQLSIKQPWESLISQFYQLISNEDLFHSSATNQWLTLGQSRFLSPNILLQIGSSSIPQCVTKAVGILQIPVVYLPTSYLTQLQQVLRGTLHIVDQLQFSQEVFQNISSFDKECNIRNDVLFSMFLTVANELTTSDESELMNILQNNPCIPCTPNGQKLKLASQLVDPSADIHELFDPDSEMFPISEFCKQKSVHQTMLDIGLLTSNLPWDVVVECAKSIQSVYGKYNMKALKRVKLIISCIEKHIKSEQESIKPTLRQKPSYTTIHQTESPLLNIPQLQELKQIPFIPVLPKPDDYFLSWKGEGLQFSCSSQMFYSDQMNLKNNCFMLGSQKVLVNTELPDKGGCGYISRSLHAHLGFQTTPSLNDILVHFKSLIDTFESSMVEDSDKCNIVEYICRISYKALDRKLELERPTYAYLATSKEIEKPQEPTEAEKTLITFRNKPFIWTGNCFTSPENVARDWRENGPYLFELPPLLSERKSLTKVLCIERRFGVETLIGVLGKMYQQFGKDTLPDSCHKIVDAIVHELNHNTAENMKDRNELDIVLPDKSYTLYPATELSHNDSPWLPVDKECVLVHSSLNRDIALCLGVKQIRSEFLNKYVTGNQTFGMPFGQREELTQRIKNILRDYPLDVTLIKELLQNADDAKATKMCVILDKRAHGKQRIPSQEWKELQGPALLVWDDANFTEKDLEGIQKLGLGSKRDDSESIGQFGIGFNVVYHITDCPSFITGGNTLCVFDPHCYYIPGADIVNPGRRYDNLEEEFWVAMSDLRNAYLQDKPLPNQPSGLQTGSLFRFPLRYTKEQILKSNIIDDKVKTEPLTAEKLERMLNEWVPMIKEALLFLNHITEFHYYVIDDQSNEFHLKASYEAHLSDQAKQSRDELFKSLREFRRTKKSHVVTYPLCIESKEDKRSLKKIYFAPLMISKVQGTHQEYTTQKEKWLIQQGVGDIQNQLQKWRYISQVLPKHGIAASLHINDIPLGKIFCFLPLPGLSGLPVHINGQFVLSSNRRSLWSGDTEGQDEKKEWNDELMEAISSSYVHFLIEACDHYISDKPYENRDQFYYNINQYYELFPYWEPRKEGRDDAQLTSHKANPLNSNCVLMAQSVFKKLWLDNPHVLASEIFVRKGKKDEVKVQWNVLLDDEIPFHQAYFQPREKDIISILRRIQMVLTCAPHRLYKHLQEYQPAIANPASVYEFYCHHHSHILLHGCPCHIEQTPFRTKEDFIEFLWYMLYTTESIPNEYVLPDTPFGYPLLLTADNHLRYFDKDSKSIRSRFIHLFHNSLPIFLHPSLIGEPLHSSYFLLSKDIYFPMINSLFQDNFPSELKNKDVNNSDELLKMETLQKIWDCISSEKDTLFKNHQESIVKSWALLPATNKHLYNSCSPVLPIVKPSVLEVIEMKAFSVLNSLGSPVLDDKNITNSSILNYCPLMTEYNRVLSVLFYMHYQQNILHNLSSSNDIDSLLSYLSRTNYRHDVQIMNQIKALPLFKSIQGELTILTGKKVYLWSLGFCSAGYDKWAPSDTVVFLEYCGSWRKLCGNDFSLLGSQLDQKDIYRQLIFPQFNTLTDDERKQHLLYIRDHLYQEVKHDVQLRNQRGVIAHMFIESLKELACLQSPLKNPLQLLPVKEFSDHTIPIFTTFPDEFIFLSEEYREEEWMDFFRYLGLRDTVTFDEYSKFCKQVSKGNHEDLGKASDVLIRYLFSEKGKEWYNTSDNAYYLSEIGDICFVQVASLHAFSWIKAPCQPPHRFPHLDIGLTKLNEAVVFDCASLVWTIKPVVKLPSNIQDLDDDEYKTVLTRLGVITSPDTNDVYQNIINISKTGLSKFELFSTYNPEYTENVEDGAPSRAHLSDVMIDNISYLQKHEVENLIKKLHDIPCIPVSADVIEPIKTVLVKPIEVVKHLSSEDKVLIPYINEKPYYLSQIDFSLEIMGVRDTIGLKHIQHMLAKIKRKFNDTPLGLNELQTVRHAILKLREIVTTLTGYDKRSKDVVQELSPLFLPSPTGHTWQLINSTNLVFADSTRYNPKELKQFNFVDAPYSLFRIPPDTRPEQPFRTRQLESATRFFSTSERGMIEKDICLKLPREIKPKGMSLVCYESVLNPIVDVNECPLYLHMSELKRLLPHLKQLLPLIVQLCDLSCKHASTFVSTLVELLNNVNVIGTTSLQANVYLTVSIGTISPDFVFQKVNNDFTLYATKKARVTSPLMTELSQSLCIEVARILQLNLTTFLKLIPGIRECLQIKCVEEIQSLCDHYNFEVQLQFEEEEEEEDLYTPKLGRPFPEELHHMLDRDINHIFRPEEWVVYETSEQFFVWAIILYPHTVEDSEVNGEETTSNSSEPTMTRYKILLNEQDPEGETVSALDLYKLITIVPEKEAEGQELVPVDESNSSTLVRQAADSERLRGLKKRICKELRLAWRLPEEEKKKAIRRMYIKYHPDKAKPTEMDLYEEAFKFMLRQIDRLENGLSLEDPDEETPDDKETYQPSSWRRYYNQWNSYVPKYGSYGGSNRRSGGGGRGGGGGIPFDFSSLQPLPSLNEAKRWLKQAWSDCEAMRILKSELYQSRVSCQVIFLAHEVIEKALKAGMYKLVGLNPSSLVNHELYCHAQAICSQRPGRFVSLIDIASKMSSYYVKSRFPNQHPLYDAPVDVYNESHAITAAEYAEMVIKFIDEVVNKD